jgi:hypothetical protein
MIAEREVERKAPSIRERAAPWENHEYHFHVATMGSLLLERSLGLPIAFLHDRGNNHAKKAALTSC